MRSIYYGSNACYLVVLAHPLAGRSLAVYKPAKGEYPLWDFPHGSLHRREVATYRLDCLLKWQLVPPTVISSGTYGRGSVQLFVEESDERAVPRNSLRRLVLLDWITNNADRKPDHVLIAPNGHLWGIDHGLTFHVQPKLRTVFWHFAGEPLESEELDDLERLLGLLDLPDSDSLHQLLLEVESQALRRRVQALIRTAVFPNPERKAVPYIW